MKNSIFLSALVVFCACVRASAQLKNYASETLKIERITDHVYKHISYLETESYGKVPCNGMIYINGNDVLIFDAPTNNSASAELIEWIGERNIKSVLVTHFHIDCLGGLEEFHSNKIESYATNLTIALAKNDSTELPKNGFDKKMEFNIGGSIAVGEFFGQGHTSDNIVGYIPSENALFGGCLIKAMNSGKGNLEDAHTDEWPKTVEKIKNGIDGIKIVVPGHGKHGGIELLDFTIDVFSTK